MENLAMWVADTFQLATKPNLYDWLGHLFIFIFIFLTVMNLRSKSEETQIEDKTADEPSTDIEKAVATSEFAQAVTTAEEEAVVSLVEKVEEVSWAQRLAKGLSKTRTEVWGKVESILKSSNISEEQYEEIEEILYTADLQPSTVAELLDEMKEISKKEGESTADFLLFVRSFLKERMEPVQTKVNKDLYSFDKNDTDLKVIMIVGVNGAGKTTTIGKLATKLKSQGAKVVVGACDTFRAAAVEQLEVWCNRAQVDIVKAKEGADPSGVAFDTVKKAREDGANYCIIDTAGRLHTASNLMDELVKTKKVMGKVLESAPHETLLVLDAITGQNALRQAEEFNKALDLTGLIFTKCDGSSKAGGAVGIVQKLSVPITYIGVGEDVEDLDIFDLDQYLNALIGA